jgi:hypothetical protein
MPLYRESRFSRWYQDEHRKGTVVSRFMDGSASITALELQRGWPTWTDVERLDFCQSSYCWLHQQADFPDMLRFIMQRGGPSERSGIACSVAMLLPRDEAFGCLVRALHTTDIGHCSTSLSQAIAMTKHPDAGGRGQPLSDTGFWHVVL